DLRHIQLHGVFRDAQLAGDLVVGLAFAHQLGDLQLARGELFEDGGHFKVDIAVPDDWLSELS
nr:hypothetical protein [Tanacetum cinerariifolium]